MTAIAPVDPPKFGMSEAAKARGLNKPTVLRSIESGRLSAMRSMRDALGQRQIEPAEFHRVYSPADTVRSKTLQITSRQFVEIAVTNELNGFALFERHRTHVPGSWDFLCWFDNRNEAIEHVEKRALKLLALHECARLQLGSHAV
jgi:hypothetical protein